MDPVVQTLVAWKGAIVACWFAAVFVAEHLRPKDARGARGEERGRGPLARLARAVADERVRLAHNGGLWLLTIAIWPLVVVPVTAWAAGTQLDWRPAWWGGWPGLALDVVLLDFAIYWWHIANHRVPLLWRFHEVHHLDGMLDSTTALRFHFGEVTLSALARAGVIVLVGFPLASVLVFEMLILIGSVFHHSNLALPPALERALARVIITPSIHWVHHHKVWRDTNSNYGTIFSFWDRIFATLSPNRRAMGMAIGVEAKPEEPLGRLVAHPFLPRP